MADYTKPYNPLDKDAQYPVLLHNKKTNEKFAYSHGWLAFHKYIVMQHIFGSENVTIEILFHPIARVLYEPAKK